MRKSCQNIPGEKTRNPPEPSTSYRDERGKFTHSFPRRACFRKSYGVSREDTSTSRIKARYFMIGTRCSFNLLSGKSRCHPRSKIHEADPCVKRPHRCAVDDEVYFPASLCYKYC